MKEPQFKKLIKVYIQKLKAKKNPHAQDVHLHIHNKKSDIRKLTFNPE